MLHLNRKNSLVIGFLSISFFVLISGDFLAPLKNRLRAGQTITVHGKTGDATNDTTFSLQSGNCNWSSDRSCNKIFYFGARLTLKQAVRASYHNGWSDAETWGGFPFKPNTDYDVKIIIHDGFIELKVDENYFCTFKNVSLLDQANHIFIQTPTLLSEVSILDANEVSSVRGYYEELENIL